MGDFRLIRGELMLGDPGIRIVIRYSDELLVVSFSQQPRDHVQRELALGTVSQQPRDQNKIKLYRNGS